MASARSQTIEKPSSQKIWDPKSIEQISGSCFFFTVVLPQVEELKYVGMPWFNINGKCARALVSSLVYISCGCVVRTEHGYNTIGVAIGTSNVRPVAAYIASVIQDQGTAIPYPVARIQWILSPMPPAVLEIMAQVLRVS